MTAPAISRRDFIAASAASASTLLASRGFAADSLGFGLGVQTYTFREFDLEGALKRIQALGIKRGEFFSKHIPNNSTPEKIKAILAICKDYEVAPVGFGVSGFSKNHDANKKLFELGAALGLKYLSADPDPDSFDSLDKLCEEYQIAIAIHPHGPAGGGKLHRWYSAEIIMKAVKDHYKLIGSCLDTGHLIRSAQLGVKLDPAQQVRVMEARNFAMHLKDHDNTRKTDVVFGDPTGALDITGVFKALQEVQFKGTVSIEYEANAANPSPDMEKCVAYVNDTFKKLG